VVVVKVVKDVVVVVVVVAHAVDAVSLARTLVTPRRHAMKLRPQPQPLHQQLKVVTNPLLHHPHQPHMNTVVREESVDVDAVVAVVVEEEERVEVRAVEEARVEVREEEKVVVVVVAEDVVADPNVDRTSLISSPKHRPSRSRRSLLWPDWSGQQARGVGV
jgi:hypothetical protein